MAAPVQAQFRSTSTFKIDPKDFEAHLKALAALDPDELKGLFDKALRSGAAPIATEMRKLAPVDKGNLRKSITTRVYNIVNAGSGTGKVHARVRIGPSARKGRIGGRYAHLVELGTKPGTRRTKKTAFRIFGRGEEVVTREISHGGTKAQPFIRKAFDNKYNKANAKMRERLLKGFDEILGNYLGK